MKREQLNRIRRGSTARENHIIDEYFGGRISRRSFLRHGTMVGMSIPVLGFLASCGSDSTDDAQPSGDSDDVATGDQTTTTAAAAAGPVTVRAGMMNLATSVDPVLINDVGGVQFLSQFAETLTLSADDGTLVPVLAESWSPNDDSTVWTFNLRPGVTYSDGTPLTAADVVATFEGIAEGNASSALQTARLSPGGVVAVDDLTVEFNLDGPVGAFPYLVSTDNYNAVITPASFWDNYSEGAYEQSYIGTGPYIVESFQPEASAVLVKNPNYRDAASVTVDRVEVTFFADDVSAVAAMLDGRLDLVPFFSPAAGAPLIDNPEFDLIITPSSTHRQIHYDTTSGLFADKRVRQALGLSLDRQAMVDGLLDGFAVIGNDHPIAPSFGSHNPTSTAQRSQDLQQANELIDAAGVRDSAALDLNTYDSGENGDLAQVVQSAAREVGLDFNVAVHESGVYFSDYWLAGTPVGITGYGHRGIPNVFLDAPLRSDGPWNASGPWANDEYDALLDQFAGESDLDTQRQLAGQIQNLLNEEVPILIPYFTSNIAATRKGLSGYSSTVMGHTFLNNVELGG